MFLAVLKNQPIGSWCVTHILAFCGYFKGQEQTCFSPTSWHLVTYNFLWGHKLWSINRSMATPTFLAQNVHPNIWPTSTHIEQWNCEWWNVVIGGINVCGNEIWSNSLGDTMSSFVILSHSGKNIIDCQLWAEVIHVVIWGHMRVLPSMSWVIWDHFCLGVIFPSVTFLQLKRWGVMNFGHIWKCSSKYLTYFHSYWTMELWMVKWGYKWHWCPW